MTINHVNKVEFCHCYSCIHAYLLTPKSCKKIIGLSQSLAENVFLPEFYDFTEVTYEHIDIIHNG